MARKITNSEDDGFFDIIYAITKEIIDEYNKDPVLNSDGKHRQLRLDIRPRYLLQVHTDDRDLASGGGIIEFKYKLDLCTIKYISIITAIHPFCKTELTLVVGDPQFIEQAAHFVHKIMQKNQDDIVEARKLKEILALRPESIRGTSYPLVGL